MRLSRLGFNVLVLIWIAPVLMIDIIGNTTSTGVMSDIYYWKALTDGLVVLIASCFVFLGSGAAKTEVAKTDDEGDTVASFSKLWMVEAYYCLALSIYAGVSWWTLHEVNKTTTGIESFASMVWSFVCIIIALLGLVQFYNLKSKSIAALREKMVQD